MTIGFACVATAGSDANITGVPYSTQTAAELLPLLTAGAINTATKWASGLHVLFNGGDTFGETITTAASGADADSIVCGKYGAGADPIIDGASTRSNCISCNHNYVDFENLKCIGATSHGVSIGGSNHTFTDFESSAHGGSGISVTSGGNRDGYTMVRVNATGSVGNGFSLISASNGNAYTNFSFVDGEYSNSTGASSSGIRVSVGNTFTSTISNVSISGSICNGNILSGVFIKCDTVSSADVVTLDGVTANSNGEGGISLRGVKSTSGQSSAYNCTTNLNGATSTLGGIWLYECDSFIIDGHLSDSNTTPGIDGVGAFLDIDCNACVIRHSIFSNNTGSATSSSGAGISLYKATNSLIHGNLIFGNKDGLTYGEASRGNNIYNNTIHNNSRAQISRLGVLPSGIAIILKNNILSGGTDGYSANCINAEITNDYNCVYGASSSLFNTITQAANEITTDPLFVNAAGGDFRLDSLSPCIGTGFYIAGITDCRGLTYSEANQDIGGYAFRGDYFKKAGFKPADFYATSLGRAM